MNCPHCKIRLDFHDCIDEPGKVPDNDSCGMCYSCGGWWQFNDGELSEYIPDQEQMNMALESAWASRQRAREDAERKGKKLL